MSTKGIKVSLDLIGDRATRKKLERLSFKSIRKANRQAIRFALTPVAKAIRQNVPIDEGDLKKATATKTFGKGLNVGGVAGADAAYRATDEDGNAKVPANYDHLVEFGHVNEDGSFTPPAGYQRRAAEQALPIAEKRYIQKATEIIEKEALKQ